MIDCCVKQLEYMHGIADYFLWFQRFIMASPFILIIPELDPTASSRELLQSGIQKSGEIAYSLASNKIYQNKSLPDFVDAVKNIGRISYGQLSAAAASHGKSHAFNMKERDIFNFWMNMGAAYDEAFRAR